MAYRIAADVVSQISPPPPQGTPPQYVLAAVLAERHRRELARLQSMVPRPQWPGPPPSAYPPPVQPVSPQASNPGGFAPPG
jgi:hypothetical protein